MPIVVLPSQPSILSLSGTAESTSTSTGVLQVSGGVGIAKNLITTGKIGIGGLNPTFQLDVSGVSGTGPVARIGGFGGTYFMQSSPSMGYNCYYNASWYNGSNLGTNYHCGYWGFGLADGNLTWNTTSATSASGANLNSLLRNTFIITQSGNVGIGSASPGYTLDISNATPSGNAPFIRLTGGGNVGNKVGIILNPYWGHTGTGGAASQIWAIDDGNASAHLLFGTSPSGATTSLTERMRIQNDGNVGIGTNSTVTCMALNGTCGGNGALHIVSLANTINSGRSQDGISFKAVYDGNTIMDFRNASDVFRGAINGSGASAVVYATSSDRRLKENVMDLPSSIDIIKKLRPVNYTWNTDKKRDYGFIAQEVYKILPNMRGCLSGYSKCECNITDMSNEIYCEKCLSGEFDIDEPVDLNGKPLYYSLDYGRFTPYLTKALKEIIEIVENQQQTIQTQQQQIAEITKKLGM